MTALKENTELQGKVDEDEDDIDTLTEKNRQLVKQVCTISRFISLTPTLCPSLVLSSGSSVLGNLACSENLKFISFLISIRSPAPFFGLTKKSSLCIGLFLAC